MGKQKTKQNFGKKKPSRAERQAARGAGRKPGRSGKFARSACAEANFLGTAGRAQGHDDAMLDDYIKVNGSQPPATLAYLHLIHASEF